MRRPTCLANASMSMMLEAAFPRQLTTNIVRTASVMPTGRSFHSTTRRLDGDLDDLCGKHMELPADEFATGCSFLHQAALGNKSELERMVQERPHIGKNNQGYPFS